MKGLNECFTAAQFLVESLKDGDDLPALNDSGLCWLLSEEDEHQDMYDGFRWLFCYDICFISRIGEWSEARMNLLALLAVMDSSDFADKFGVI